MARKGVSFSVVGLAGFAGDVRELRDDMHRELEAVFAETQRRIWFRAVQRVPRDKGDLANAIQMAGRGLNRRVGLSDERVAERGGNRFRTNARGRIVGVVNSAHVNPWVYGMWVEMGLRSRNIPAQPFMGPAVDEVEPDHGRRVEAALNGAL